MTEWFKWEREATLFPLYVFLSQSMNECKKYCGASWPDMVLVFNSRIVACCLKMNELEERSKDFYEWYVKNSSKWHDDLDKLTRKLNAFRETRTPLENYKEFISVYEKWWTICTMVEPIAIHSEKLLKNALEKRKQDKQTFSLLTSPTKESFSMRQERELIETKGEKHRLEWHAKKYYYLHNNYLTTEVLDVNFFRKEFESLKERHENLDEYVLETQRHFQEVVKNKEKKTDSLELNQEEKKAVEVVDEFCFLQDYRKELTMKYLHVLDDLLSAVGKVKGYSLQEMKYCLPSEVSNPPAKEVLHARMRHCFIKWVDGKENFEIMAVGEQAKKEEGKMFPKSELAKDIVEIDGTTANYGRVRGKAFVTMDAKEAAKIEKGQILITSMTSPDFIAGIKKAAGIVTNEGGITCHAAIIAREFNVPCVVGTKIATKIFKNGDLVEVDGNHGKVRRILN